MQPDEYIIEQLSIEAFSKAEQEEMLNEVRMRIGEAVSESLSEQQLNEYQAIIDANDSVIQPWLEQNVPEYKNTVVYQQLVEDSASDPEHNDPAKLFANLAWVELNIPNRKEIADAVITDYKRKYLTTS